MGVKHITFNRHLLLLQLYKMPSEVTERSLAFIRYLYKVAMEQSRQPEPLAGTSILTFHDSVELFLQLICRELRVSKDDLDFMSYWKKLEGKLPNRNSLGYQEPMRELNKVRGQLKHQSTIPAKVEIDAARFHVTAFFQEYTSLIFGIEFDNISMVNFVQYMPARDNLDEASKLIEQQNFEETQHRIAVAFAQIIDDYENRKRSRYGQSPFFFGGSLSFLDSSHLEVQGKNIQKYVDTVKESIESMRDAMKVLLRFRLSTIY
jgi:hypothetical protein